MTERAGGEAWPDIAGRIDGMTHRYPVRVYYEDTDFSGAVYHANYLKFCERGRSDFLRLIGIHHSDLRDAVWEGRSYGFVARKITMDFLKPAMIDDLLEVETTFVRVSGARFEINQKVARAGARIFEADVTVALVGAGGRPVRVPGRMLDLVAPYVADVTG